MVDAAATLNAALQGRYSIRRRLGEGGMATVFLADDGRHQRKVAIKVLKPELAAAIGSDRFLAEIRTTANLQHPHIVPLFDSGEADGFLFYVMPYLAGESLRARLDRERQLPIDEAVRIARGVAEALDYAHRQGVVHRDIKPANILLHEGQPQVSDFGIALAVSAAGGERLTKTGTSLGTPHYMSPEQAAGEQDITPRSDLYSLGAVLYEMLSGDPPHTGPSSQAVLSRILTEEPRPIDDARRSVPPHVAGVVRRALEKLPADRFGSGEELARALSDPTFRWPREPTRSLAARLVPLAGYAVAAVMAAFAAWGWLRSPGSDAAGPVSRLVVPLAEDQRLSVAGGGAFPFDLSRDGRSIVYRAQKGGDNRLFLRDLDSFDARELAGTDEARQPFFSPDGRWVGFFAERELRRVSVDGGAPLTITGVGAEPFGASWGSGGRILFSLRGDGLYSVPETGGKAEGIELAPVNAPVGGEADSAAALVSAGSPRWPHLLPGNRHALLTTDGGTGILTLATGELRYILSGSQAVYLPTGHLLFNAGEERLRLVPFDLDRLEVAGAPLPALENVFRGPGSGAAHFRVSETGTLVFVAGGFQRSLVLVDRTGRESSLAVEPRGYRFPEISPDGDLIAVTVDPRPSDIWVVDVRRESARRLTTTRHNIAPSWHPDGDRLTFWRNGDVHWLPWPEGGEPRRVSDRPLNQYGPTWLRDGRIIVFEPAPGTGGGLLALDAETGEAAEFWVTPANEYSPRASPDGSWVAFTSDVSGAEEVYVLPSSGGGSPVLVSVGGGSDGTWSADGTEIFYRSGSTIMAVPVKTSPAFSPGIPEPLFSGPYDFAQGGNWDVGPDGRFVMIRADPRTSRQFQVVPNWFEEIGRP